LASSTHFLDHYIIKSGVHSPKKADILKQNKRFEIVSMDYYNPETISNALQGVDKLFWLIPLTPNTTQISSNFIKEAKKNGVKHIAKLSVMGADVEPPITITRLHRQVERIIDESGIPYTFLRPVGFLCKIL
jgi:uncharacterized protein YbjT (DUF2867 family)